MAILGQQLDKGSQLPDLTWNMLDGSTFNLANDIRNRWTVVVILRGHW